MVVKINGKPILVEEKEDKDGIDWVQIGLATVGTLMGLWVLDYAAYLFLYIHPFPFIKFVGVILSWF